MSLSIMVLVPQSILSTLQLPLFHLLSLFLPCFTVILHIICHGCVCVVHLLVCAICHNAFPSSLPVQISHSRSFSLSISHITSPPVLFASLFPSLSHPPGLISSLFPTLSLPLSCLPY
uniref:Uncharacterized protein n=1 Tax=Cacopsylla melanoneura TaxID=428564 RepID=A0A8D9E8D8_9HEMI